MSGSGEFLTFMTAMKFMQKLQISNPFKIYEKIYKSVFEKIFRKSSVSMCFRIKFKNELIGKIIHNEDKLRIKSEVVNFVKDKKNYINNNNDSRSGCMIDIKKVESFIQKDILPYTNSNDENNIEVDILFIKRASSDRDRYSGHIAFPGGRYEKTDNDDFTTAIRETKEEIGITLCDDIDNQGQENINIISSYIGRNINFDITIDFKYFVSSHIFIIFDLFNECEKEFILSENELSDAFFVPLKYFLNLTHENKKNYVKPILQKTFGHNVSIDKLILNNDEKFLIYGLTLRKFMNLMNIQKENIRYHEEVVFENKSNIFKPITHKISLHLFKFLTNPYRSYTLLRNLIGVVIFYKLYVYLSKF
jgi:8-oxo-dGTP pyrophosphatase MutT (NUDIX family)